MRLEYAIARDLSRTHSELLESVSGFELARWKALYSVEGQERQAQAAEAEPGPPRRFGGG